MLKKFAFIFHLVYIIFSTASFADVPSVNHYSVQKRYFSLEPNSEQLAISAEDRALLAMPRISRYTQLNLLKPGEVYTIRPYPYIESFPKIGKWMLTAKALQAKHVPQTPTQVSLVNRPLIKYLIPAHWICLTNARDQYIIEPINYIFVVYADALNKAIKKMTQVINNVGFSSTASDNHSGGYYAFIGDDFFDQLRNQADFSLTFSNGDFRFQSDHFRAFGAYPLQLNQGQAFIFTAAVSEESGIDSEWVGYPLAKIKQLSEKVLEEGRKTGNYANYGHHFVSFANARNNLATALIKAGYPTYYANLANVVNLTASTEDHDGNVYITVIR